MFLWENISVYIADFTPLYLLAMVNINRLSAYICHESADSVNIT
jgi:hypothetical protein